MTELFQSTPLCSSQFDSLRSDANEELVTECTDCGRTFGFIVRRNKCRICRNIYCGKCVNYRIVVDGYEEKQRVCEKCKQDVLCNSQRPPCSPKAPKAIPKDAIRSSLCAQNVLEIEDQAEEDISSMLFKRKLASFDKENIMPLSAVNAVRAAKESENRQFGDILSCFPSALGASIRSPEDISHPMSSRQPLAETVTPPVMRRGVGQPVQQELSPDRSRRCPSQDDPRSKITRQEHPAMATKVHGSACVDSSASVSTVAVDEEPTDRSDICSSGLRDAPESPLLPLRRVYRDPVSGKYIEERDLLIDESIVDDLEPYVVYDSDLDGTLDQSSLRLHASPVKTKSALPASVPQSKPESDVKVLTAMSVPVLSVKEEGVLKQVLSTMEVEAPVPHIESPPPMLRAGDAEGAAASDAYEESCAEAEAETSGTGSGGMSYHVIITAHELKSKAAEEEPIPPALVPTVDITLKPDTLVNSTKKKKRLQPSLKPKQTFSCEEEDSYLSTPPRATRQQRRASAKTKGLVAEKSEEDVISLMDHDHFQLFRSLSPKKLSLTRVLLALSLLLLVTVLMPIETRLSPSRTPSAQIGADSADSYVPIKDMDKHLVADEVQGSTLGIGDDFLIEKVAVESGMLREFASETISDTMRGAGELKASPESGKIVASTLTIHIGVQGFQATCPVNGDRKRREALVAALSQSPSSLLLEGVEEGEEEGKEEEEEEWGRKEGEFSLQRVYAGDGQAWERSLVTKEFILHQKEVLLRAMRQLLAIPEVLSRVILKVIRQVLGESATQAIRV
jgi:hypothetical protein